MPRMVGPIYAKKKIGVGLTSSERDALIAIALFVYWIEPHAPFSCRHFHHRHRCAAP